MNRKYINKIMRIAFLVLVIIVIVGKHVDIKANDQDTVITELKSGKNIIVSGVSENDMNVYTFEMPYDGYLKFANVTSDYKLYEIKNEEHVPVEGIMKGGTRYYIGFYGKGEKGEYVWATRVSFVPLVVSMNIKVLRDNFIGGMVFEEDELCELDIKYCDGSEEIIKNGFKDVYTKRDCCIRVSFESDSNKYYNYEEVPSGRATLVFTSQNGVNCRYDINIQDINEYVAGAVDKGVNEIISSENKYYKFVPVQSSVYTFGKCDELQIFLYEQYEDEVRIRKIRVDVSDYSDYIKTVNMEKGRTYYIVVSNKNQISEIGLCIADDKESNIVDTGHDYMNVCEKASYHKPGYKGYVCKICGKLYIKNEIEPINDIKLEYKECEYKGKACKPSVILLNPESKKISSKNYTIKYSDNNCAGVATVKIILKGDYKGTIVENFDIKPTSPILKSVEGTQKGVKIVWSKVSGAKFYIVRDEYGRDVAKVLGANNVSCIDTVALKKQGEMISYHVVAYGESKQGETLSESSNKKKIVYIYPIKIVKVTNESKNTIKLQMDKSYSGYQLQYSTNKNMKYAKTVKISKHGSKYNLHAKFLKGKRYYIRVRNVRHYIYQKYTKDVFSSWSNMKSVYIDK